MPQIKVLPKSIAELIAAGEVVERPSAVIKELVENSIDAGATKITVEIKRGGILFIGVTDDGCGFSMSDVPTAFLRHATSKITSASDLDSIGTLGFRGEALAAISAVSKTEIITRTSDSEIGTRCVVEGGVQTELEEIGCDKGTIITVRDIFYNTPARMKFLKSDVTEANSAAAVVDRMALSHPEIAFKFIRDGKITLATSGDGNLKNVIYSVLGRDFASSLIEVSDDIDGIGVKGYICKPIYCKQNRNGEFFFLNGRLVRSNTAVAAIEQAYKNSVMVGKFPCCVLNIIVPNNTVDVNVHPAKTEVRFSDEKRIFSAVYYASRNALQKGDTRPEIKPQPPKINPFAPQRDNGYRQAAIFEQSPTIKAPAIKAEPEIKAPAFLGGNETPKVVFESPKIEFYDKIYSAPQNTETENTPSETEAPIIKAEPPREEMPKVEDRVIPEIKLIGQAFNTYIIVQSENEIYLIDKHAAHERILFEKLKQSESIEVQTLLLPVTLTLTKEEYINLINNTELLKKAGFETEDFGNGTVIVRTVPAMLSNEDIPLLLGEICEKLESGGNNILNSRIDDIFHTVACKAAIKGNSHTTDTELMKLAEQILSSNDIMYCPHGRPVAYKIKKYELEKYFGRIQ